MQPSPEVQKVLDRLDKVRKDGSGWSARCPCRDDDQNPSLHVGQGRDGRALLTCHRGNGCNLDEICAAIDLAPKDLFPPSTEKPRKKGLEFVEEYQYCDEDGQILFWKARYLDENGRKTFRQYRKRGSEKVWNLDGIPKVLYQLPAVAQAVAEGDVILVCYTPDTEVLTPTGWVPFPAARGSMVAQWNAGEVSFVEPSAWQEFDYEGDLVNIRADWVDLLVTPDHRQPWRRERCHPKVSPASEIGANVLLPTSGRRVGHLDVTPAQARLIAMWQADGIDEQRGSQVSWNVKKDRKKDRIRHILSENGVAWTEHVYPACPAWTNFRVRRADLPLDLADGKEFAWSTLDWPLEARIALLEELGHWDGDFVGKVGIRFFTAEERNADVIAAVAATSGYSCIVRKDERPSRPEQRTQFVLNLGPREERLITKRPSLVEGYDGKVYCCTVPSGFLVVRRAGKTVISGNCEGEKDVHTAEKLGFVATTMPGGAGKWLDIHTEALAGATEVLIVADNDEVGLEHAEAVYEALRPVVDEVSIWRAPAPHKDLSDLIAAGGSWADLEPCDAAEAPDPLDAVFERLRGSEGPLERRVAKALRQIRAIEAPAEDPGRLVHWVDFLNEAADDTYDWVIPGLLERGDRLMIVAPEGGSKSTLIRHMAITASSGIHPFTRGAMQPIRALVVDLENPDRIVRRTSRKIVEGARQVSKRDPDAHLLIRRQGMNLLNPSDVHWLFEKVEAIKPDVVFLGPIYKSFIDSGDKTSEATITQVVMIFDELISEFNVAMVFEHHAPLGDKYGREIRPFGSAVWQRWPEFGIGLKPDADAPGVLSVNHWRGARDERDWPKRLRRSTGLFIFDAEFD